MSKPNDPAFGAHRTEIDQGVIRFIGHSDGLTKRELIAAMVLQGVVGNRDIADGLANSDPKGTGLLIVAAAVRYADALLAELARTAGRDGEGAE